MWPLCAFIFQKLSGPCSGPRITPYMWDASVCTATLDIYLESHGFYHRLLSFQFLLLSAIFSAKLTKKRLGAHLFFLNIFWSPYSDVCFVQHSKNSSCQVFEAALYDPQLCHGFCSCCGTLLACFPIFCDDHPKVFLLSVISSSPKW